MSIPGGSEGHVHRSHCGKDHGIVEDLEVANGAGVESECHKMGIKGKYPGKRNRVI